jgi:hypothetical protein
MPVTLGANNTIRVNGKVIEFGKFDGTTPSQNVVTTSTLSAPTMTSAAAIPPVQTADTGIKYVSFTTTNTPYNVTFPTSVSCDILIVGGGGGASGSYNGSGAGGVLYMVNKIFQGGTAYKVLVGGGATGGNGGNSSITLGNDTAISFDGITLIGKGGGGHLEVRVVVVVVIILIIQQHKVILFGMDHHMLLEVIMGGLPTQTGEGEQEDQEMPMVALDEQLVLQDQVLLMDRVVRVIMGMGKVGDQKT